MNRPANTDDAFMSGDWLDRVLAERSHERPGAYLLDDGFTARVMSSLPAPARPLAWRKPVVGALWTAAAVGFAMTLPGTAIDVTREAFRLFAGKPFALSDLALLLAAAGGGVWTTVWLTWRRA
ncbi:MAG TPA: hypothetical protein VGV08_00765 [Casimicrobiaceae bacterium]|nr:hypothetical protein [Casimicrobiaceae bacterium]